MVSAASAQQSEWEYLNLPHSSCSLATAHWPGKTAVGFNNPQALLHLHSVFCDINSSFTPSAIRLQTKHGNTDNFGLSSIEFWSNAQSSAYQWAVGAIRPTTNGAAPFDSSNAGNWFGGIGFYCSGSSSAPQDASLTEVMRIYDRRAAINSAAALGRFDINLAPDAAFMHRIVFDDGTPDNKGPILKFYRISGTQPFNEFGDAYPLWMTYETELPAQLGYSDFNIFNGASVSPLGSETSDSMKRIFTITGNGNTGINEHAPDAKFQVTNGSVLFMGAHGDVPKKWTRPMGTWMQSEIGEGTRLMWIPSKAAFRAGYASTTGWNTSMIGKYSTAVGRYTIAEAYGSIAMGIACETLGDASDEENGHGSIAAGHNCKTYGFDAVALGGYNLAREDFTVALGYNNNAYNKHCISIGTHATTGDIGHPNSEDYTYCAALGFGVIAEGFNAFVIGTGTFDAGGIAPLTHNVNQSLGIGFNSNIPTFFVGPASGSGTYGNTGIGTIAPLNRMDVNGSVSIGHGATPPPVGSANSLSVNGRVGVGTASPQAALSVVGSGDNNQVVIWSTDQAAEDSNEVDLVVEKKVLIGRSSNFGSATELLQVDGGAMKSSGGTDWTVPSDIRYKKDIAPFSDGLEKLRNINPVWFRYNGNMGLNDKGQEVGVIAQDIQKVLPHCITESEISQTTITKPERRYQVDAFDTIIVQVPDKSQRDEHGHYIMKDSIIIKPTKHLVIEPAEYATEKAPILTYNSNALRYILINSVKELDSTVKEMDERYNSQLNDLNAVIDSLRLIVSNQEIRIARLETQSKIDREEVSDIILEQNNPNPYSTTTTISYYIPASVVGSPQLVVTRSSGSQVLLWYDAIKGPPTQQIVDATTLDTGVYVYSLVVQDKVLASKKMIVIK